MRLLTNSNNTNALKIVIASKISQTDLTICEESIDKLVLKSPKVVPQLVLESGTHVFSSNAAAKFLFLPSPQTAAIINYYLDLEASFIQPLTAFFNLKSNYTIAKSFKEVLCKLEQELSSKKFLAGEAISVADIVIWSTLYPLWTEHKIKDEFMGSQISLAKWFNRIHTMPEVMSALQTYPVKEGVTSIGNLISNTVIPSKESLKNSHDTNNDEYLESMTEEEKKAAAFAWQENVKRRRKLLVNPVLPKPGERNVLITSALPYVNNVPHLGNIIGCVLSGDVFARYCRLRGYNTLYISGTDEYGTATEMKALEENLSPQDICDKYFNIHKKIYKWFNISFDHFGRTTTPQQTEICHDIFEKVYRNGYISSDSVKQLLCEKCNRYLADRFVEGTCPRCRYEDARGDQCDVCGLLINATELIHPRCKMCQQEPVLRYSQQFFLDLPKIEPLLQTWIKDSSPNWTHNAREISKAWLKDGLKPRCITRDLEWGIPVPVEGFEKKVFYVWFDAPIGYISITKLYTREWKKWWMPQDSKIEMYQFMAKDNVPFHSIMFPASLLATEENYTLVNHIFATEYLNYENQKFSKSRGVGVFGNDAQETGIPADVWRFYLLYVRPETQDSSFSWPDLALKNNSELLSILGNFINRALVFCKKNHEGKVPRMSLLESDYELLAMVNQELSHYIEALERGKLREGIIHMLMIARYGNQLMQSSQPWVLCKGTDDDKNRCGTVIGLCINLSCLLSQLCQPFMPHTASIIRAQLNAPPELEVIEDKFHVLLPTGHKIGEPFPLFQKIEAEHVKKLKNMFSGRTKSASPPAGGDGESRQNPKIKSQRNQTTE